MGNRTPFVGRTPPHPLGEVLRAAARGEFPDPDGGWSRVPPWRPEIEGMVSFTSHAMLAIAGDITDERLAALGVEGYGGATHPRVLGELAGPGGWIDTLDVLLIATGTAAPGGTVPGGPAGATPGGDGLVARPDLADHPRTAFALRLRDELRILGRPDPADRSVVVLGHGLGGLIELSFEVDQPQRGRGAGRALLRSVLAVVPHGEPVLAACAPGNAASLRSLLGAGFAPIASVQLFARAPGRLTGGPL